MAATDGAGLVACACWEQHAALKWEKSGFFVVLLVTCVTCGVFLPYITTSIRKLMPIVLPTISQSGGEPPSNGVFAISMEIGAFFGIFVFLLLLVSIHQRNYHNNKIVRYVNIFNLLFMFSTWFGLINTVCNPVGYTDLPNKFQWVTTVLFEHGIGATLILVGLAIFQFMLAIIWWYLPDTSKTEKYIKVAFAVVYILLFLITLYPLPAYIYEMLGPNIFDFKYMKTISYSMPKQYSTVYQICSFSEWTIVILSIVNFSTFYGVLQKVSVRILFRHKSCLEEEPNLSLKIIS